jgi:competence ComEA-like helix-hairpin-helix protein
VKSKFLKEYFSFSKREKNGLLVLFAILFVLIITRVIISNSGSKDTLDFDEFENQIDVFLSYAAPDLENGERFDFDPNTTSKEDFLKMGLSMKTVNGILSFREKGWKFYKPEDLEKVWEILPEEYEAVKDYIKIESAGGYTQKTYKKKTYDKKQSGELFEFDPNTAEKDEFEALGLKSWQADNIIKFREKGGVFRTPADFGKVYGIEPETFSKLEPFIAINTESLPQTNTQKKSNAIVKINSATEADFQQLSGIGPAYSKRIVEYRTRLGGFLSIEQIREVYGMTDELFESIKVNLVLDDVEIKKVNINTAEYKDLVYHPYISKENAKNILNYRNFAGKIKSFDELLKQKAINKESFDKLNPYITVE